MMGLSPLLVDTYRRYKRDTKTFTQWLGATAQATGLINDVLKDNTAGKDPNKTKRKKGKQQKPRNRFGSYKVPVRVLVQLANAIVEAKVSEVPRHILNVLKDVITARKGCATWYRVHQTDEPDITKQHNEGHQHIIEILEEVHQILAPLEERRASQKSSEQAESTAYVNLFGLLEVEQCPDMETEGSWIPVPIKKLSQNIYEPESTPEDVSFALYCFMKDMTDIRIFIRRTWREYKRKHITLNSAALTANTGIDIMRRLNEAFVEEYPEFSEHPALIAYLYDGYIDPDMANGDRSTSHDFAAYRGEDITLSSKSFFCDYTTNQVKIFYSVDKTPMYHGESASALQVTDAEKDFLRCLTHFNILDAALEASDLPTTSDSFYREDQVLRAVHTMKTEKKFPTWAIFACQIFIDTRRELDSHISRGFEDLEKTWTWLRQAWTECLDDDKTTTMKDRETAFYAPIKQSMNTFNLVVEEDSIRLLLEDSCKHQPHIIERFIFERHFLLRNHPLLCGLWLQEGLRFMHSIGTKLADLQGPVRTAIHLSNAVNLGESPTADSVWSDLAYIIKKHGAPHIFVGERPTELSDCYQHMRLAFGVNPSLFAKDKGKHANEQVLSHEGLRSKSRKLYRRLRPMSRYTDVTESGEGKKYEITRAAEDPSILMEALVSRLINSKDLTCPSKPHNEKNYKKAHFLTPLQSLKIFKEALKEDDLPLRFDLMSLNWRCFDLLEGVKHLCLELSPLDYPAEKLGGDYHVRTVIMHMLEGLSGATRAQPTRFHEACLLVRDVIAREKNVEILAAQARMGIVKGPARVDEEDPEDFEDPPEHFIPHRLRDLMKNVSAERLAHLKTRAGVPQDGSSQQTMKALEESGTVFDAGQGVRVFVRHTDETQGGQDDKHRGLVDL